MFGLRRSQPKTSIDWSSLLSLLEDDDRRAAIERFYPSEGRESFLTALRRLDGPAADAVLAAGRRLDTAERLVDWPTVAIAGMLNSGKTSLVATFLSEHGRARTLRGANNDQGTHRFVLWLPTAWQADVELWGLLMSRIGEAVGQPPEMLADDPAEAHQQYNNRDGQAPLLAVPLVATDPGLDRSGIGLLDCPDIVSDEALGLGSPEVRRKLLGKAATLCSAFLVVTAAESSRDGTLGDLMRIAADLMPGVPRMLAVNKVRPRQMPDQVYETFTPLARAHGIETIYAAYDYEVPASRPFIPTGEHDLAATDDEILPVFFSLSSDADDNPPAAIPDNRLLRALPERLDRGQLFEKFRIALEAGLRHAVWEHGFTRIDRDAEQSVGVTKKAQLCLLDASLDFFAHREIGGDVAELRLHQSERIIRQLSESFAATAPWYARWGVRLNAKVRQIFGGAGDFIRQLAPSSLAQRTAGEVKDKFRKGEYGGLITPDRLISAIDRHGGVISLPHWIAAAAEQEGASGAGTSGPDAQAPATDPYAPPASEQSASSFDHSFWKEAAEAAITRFDRDDFTSLDPRRLDDAVRQMWNEVPTHKKLTAGLTPLAAMLAACAGVLMIPVDFGTSFVAQASIAELLAAAGFTTLATVWSGGKNTRHVGQAAARQQLADFHAVLCDTFGVARPIDAPAIKVSGAKEILPISQIVRRNSVGPNLAVYRLREEFRQELQRLVPRS